MQIWSLVLLFYVAVETSIWIRWNKFR